MMRVAVVGAGVMGLASARELVKSGHQVTVFEKHPLFHTRGSSHGTSRIIRKAYADPFYCSLMKEAYALWENLEQESKTELFVRCGLLIFGKPEDSFLRDTRNSLVQNRISFDSFSYIDAMKRFPGIHLEPNEETIFEMDAGYLKAVKVLKSLMEWCRERGVVIQENRHAKLEDLANEFDAAVICAGSRIREFVDFECKISLQHVAYFNRHDTHNLPCWIDAGNLFYGIPDYGKGIKVAQHVLGEETDVDSVNELDKSEVRKIWEYAKFRFGNHVEVGDAIHCLYTSTPSEDFRIGKIGANIPIFYLSPCSGHGFKFAVWMGKMAAELVDGTKVVEDFPKFLEGTS